MADWPPRIPSPNEQLDREDPTGRPAATIAWQAGTRMLHRQGQRMGWRQARGVSAEGFSRQLLRERKNYTGIEVGPPLRSLAWHQWTARSDAGDGFGFRIVR